MENIYKQYHSTEKIRNYKNQLKDIGCHNVLAELTNGDLALTVSIIDIGEPLIFYQFSYFDTKTNEWESIEDEYCIKAENFSEQHVLKHFNRVVKDANGEYVIPDEIMQQSYIELVD